MIDKKKYSVVAIGNAMLDVLCEVPEQFLSQEQISKGAMNLVSRERSNYILKINLILRLILLAFLQLIKIKKEL